MNDLISIIINVYNGEGFIAKCLESVINQTYKKLEILVVNDGSTDNSLKICESYKDKRIRIITTKNFGLSKSRNIGIDNSKGKYIYFVDSDDFIEKDTIEYLYNLCIKQKVSLATCKTFDIYDYNYKVNHKMELITIDTSKEYIKKILMNKDRAVIVCNKLIKRELIENLRFEDRIINDVAFSYKLVLNTDKIAVSNQCKYFYLRHKNSITGKVNESRAIDLYNVALERYNYLKSIYPDFIENEMGLCLKIILVYCNNSQKVKRFVKEQKSIKLFRKLCSFKMLKANSKINEKIKIILFFINPKLYRFFKNKYCNVKYKYKF